MRVQACKWYHYSNRASDNDEALQFALYSMDTGVFLNRAETLSLIFLTMLVVSEK